MTSERFIWLLLAVVGILLLLGFAGGLYTKVAGILHGL
jgi:hypothetical protein